MKKILIFLTLLALSKGAVQNVEKFDHSECVENSCENLEVVRTEEKPLERISNSLYTQPVIFNDGGGGGNGNDAKVSYDVFNESEGNDSFYDADFFSTPINNDKQVVSINGTIHMNKFLWIDTGTNNDYFKFILNGKAHLELYFKSVPSSCNYSAAVYSIPNTANPIVNNSDVKFIGRTYGTGSEKPCADLYVDPGIFYISVYSNNESYNDSVSYNLILEITYNVKKESISELRYCKGAKGAVWLADYYPSSLTPLYNNGSSILFKDSFTYSSSNPEDKRLRNLGVTGGPVKYASIYIWDKELREYFLGKVNEILEAVSKNCSETQEVKAKVDTTTTVVRGARVITGLTLNFFKAKATTAFATFAFTAGSFGSIAFFGIVAFALGIFGKLVQEEEREAQQYIQYLNYVQGLLDYDEEKTSDQEVIKIDSYYKISTTKISYNPNSRSWREDTTWWLDASYRELPTLYKDDEISGHPDGANFNGTIYPMVGEDDYIDALNGIYKTFPDVNTGGNKKLNLGAEEGNNGILHRGEYLWYNFTAQKSATYEFRTVSEMDTYGELYPAIVPGKSTSLCLKASDDYYGLNFSIQYKMTAGQTVYLRVRGCYWTKTGLFYVLVKTI